MYLIDTRKYDDSFLLAKILEKVDFTDEETKKLFKHFEIPTVDTVGVVAKNETTTLLQKGEKMRLIDADELIEVAHRIRLDSRERIERMIEYAPTVDPVKHGHWIINDNRNTCRCSYCGNMELVDWALEQAKYCPHCGAKMDEVSDEINN